MNEELEVLLREVMHPETGSNIVDSGFVDRADKGEDGAIAITLRFQKARDPFVISSGLPRDMSARSILSREQLQR